MSFTGQSLCPLPVNSQWVSLTWICRPARLNSVGRFASFLARPLRWPLSSSIPQCKLFSLRCDLAQVQSPISHGLAWSRVRMINCTMTYAAWKSRGSYVSYFLHLDSFHIFRCIWCLLDHWPFRRYEGDWFFFTSLVRYKFIVCYACFRIIIVCPYLQFWLTCFF